AARVDPVAVPCDVGAGGRALRTGRRGARAVGAALRVGARLVDADAGLLRPRLSGDRRALAGALRTQRASGTALEALAPGDGAVGSRAARYGIAASARTICGARARLAVVGAACAKFLVAGSERGGALRGGAASLAGRVVAQTAIGI